MRRSSSLVAILFTVGCGTAPEAEADRATVVGRIQGTEFSVPTEAAAVWFAHEALAQLRLSEATDGCEEPQGWSLLVQINDDQANEYVIGADATEEPGEGFLVEYRREDGAVAMPAEADGFLALTHRSEDFVAGSLSLETEGGATLLAIFEARACPTTVFVTP